MKLLLDTHLLLWTAGNSQRLSTDAVRLIRNNDNSLFFSAASLWEVVIKQGLGRSDFEIDASLLRRGLLDNGFSELSVESMHALAVGSLPLLHKDPFDRILLAQAHVEGMLLLTSDEVLAQYSGPVQLV